MPCQDKAFRQSLYRQEERKCFNTLRALIHELTGEELQKRHEILQKAINLLLAASELRKLKEAQAGRPTPSQMRALTATQDVTLAHIGHSAEFAQPHGWGPTAELGGRYAFQPYDQAEEQYPAFNVDSDTNQAELDGRYAFQSYDQVEEQYPASNVDSAMNQASYPGYRYAGDRSNYS